MVTSNGEPLAPPTDQHLDAALWRIRESVGKKISQEESLRSRRHRRWGSVAVGAFLFGGGLALGGAALRPLVDPPPVFQVACYGTTPPSSAVAVVEFDTEAHAASARLDPAAACENIQMQNAQVDDIDSIVTGLMNQGSTCGTVTTDDGPTWMFEQTGDGFSLTTGTFSEPLGPDCATVHVAHVASPSTEHFGGIACGVSAGRVNVYASSSTDPAAVCRANGYDPYSPPTTN